MILQNSLLNNPEVLTISLAIVLIVVFYFVFIKIFGVKNKGLVVLGSLVFASIASWNTYKNEFYGFGNIIAILIYIVVFIIFVKIIWSFIKHVRTQI